MKQLVILFCLFGFLFTPKLKVIDSEAYRWAGGRQESGMGTNYTFKLVAGKSSEVLKIDQLWIGDKYFKVYPQRQLKNLSIISEFNKKDTIIIQVNHKVLPTDNGMQEVFSDVQIAKPYEYEGQALIGYKLKGKQKYLEIPEINFSEMKNYQ